MISLFNILPYLIILPYWINTTHLVDALVCKLLRCPILNFLLLGLLLNETRLRQSKSYLKLYFMISIRNQIDRPGERDWNKVKVLQISILCQALEVRLTGQGRLQESNHPQLTGSRIDWLTGQGCLRREWPLPILQATFYRAKVWPHKVANEIVVMLRLHAGGQLNYNLPYSSCLT